jgi:hypothetical protein
MCWGSTPVFTASSAIFQDDKALTFTVDATGAPGMQWPEPRLGPVRPKLVWKIGKVER